MGVLSLLTSIREIKKAVVGDMMGTLLETMGDSKGEVVAAVMGFALTTMNQAGDAMGLGSLQRCCYVGKKETCIITLLDNTIIAAYIDPSAPISGVEKKLDTALYRNQQ